MKNKLFLLIGVILVLSLGLTSCDDKSSSKGPNLTAFALLTNSDAKSMNWNPQNSFPKGSYLGFAVSFEPAETPVKGCYISFKQNNTQVIYLDATFDTTYNKPTNLYIPTKEAVPLEPGNYSVECYVIDTDGIKSGTKKQNLTITN